MKYVSLDFSVFFYFGAISAFVEWLERAVSSLTTYLQEKYF